MGARIVGKKIFLIGQDRVGNLPLSALFALSDLADFEYIHFNSISGVTPATSISGVKNEFIIHERHKIDTSSFFHIAEILLAT